MIVGGLDPSGSPKRPSGLALIDVVSNEIVYADLLYSDKEIIDTILKYNPSVIAIDSPLSLTERGFREVDILMKKMGYPVLPPSWRGMRMLVIRSLKIMNELNGHGIIVIETHPKSALRSSNCRTAADLFIKIFGKCRHEWIFYKDLCDALISSLVAKYYVESNIIQVRASDGVIYLLPKVCNHGYR